MNRRFMSQSSGLLLAALASSVVFLLGWAVPAEAAPGRLVGFVSNRSAQETVTGANLYLDANPDHTVVLRTPEQLAGLTDEAVSELWRDADALLFLGVHGEQVPRLLRLLEASPLASKATLLAFSSDPRLTPLARLDGKLVFQGLEDTAFRALTHNLSAAKDRAKERQRLSALYPAQAAWLEASGYRDARASENMAGLLAWVAARHARGIVVPAPVVHDAVRFMVDGAIRPAGALGLDPGRAAIAILDYDSGDRAGDREVHAALGKALAKHELSCLSLLARWGEASVSALEELPSALGEVELAGVVVIQDFVVGGGEGRGRPCLRG
ncbi:MAG: cobaltochelatase subunit CobN, partial [Myxococcota bacterium]